MDIDKEFPSKSAFLKAEDIPPNSRVEVEIADVVKVEFEGGDTAPALVLAGKEKKLRLNATNKGTLKAIYGKDTDAWVGQKIKVWHDPSVTFGGQTVGGLKIVLDGADAKDEDIPF